MSVIEGGAVFLLLLASVVFFAAVASVLVLLLWLLVKATSNAAPGKDGTSKLCILCTEKHTLESRRLLFLGDSTCAVVFLPGRGACGDPALLWFRLGMDRRQLLLSCVSSFPFLLG
jgi:hypothetical protein